MPEKRHRLAERRKAVGLSQERLAETIGVDRSTVVRWERGETHPHPWHRPRLAHALAVSIEELAGLLGGSPGQVAPGATGSTGQVPPPPAPATAPGPALVPAPRTPGRTPAAGHMPAPAGPRPGAGARAGPGSGSPQVDGLTRGLRARLLVRGAAGGPEPTGRELAAVDREVRLAHDAYQRADYQRAVRALPALITDAEQLVRSATTRRYEQQAQRLLAISFLAASKVATKLGDGVLGWVAADRAVTAALAAGDRAVSGVGAYQVARALLQTPDRLGEAAEVLAAAVAELRRPREPDGPAERSVLGALLLLAAVVAARRQQPAEASARLAAASELAARQRRDDNQLWTGFGPTNVRIHALSVAVALRQPRRAVEIAETLDPSALPAALVSRRAQVHIDLATGFSQATAGGPPALLHLLEAERIAPELVRLSHVTRTLLARLLRQERRLAMPGLRPLAARAGVLG